MALKKEIMQTDGVITKYHRILFLKTTTNKQNSIAVASYIDEIAREQEKEAVIAQPYCQTVTYETAYSESMTISAAYEFLKTLPPFENAADI